MAARKKAHDEPRAKTGPGAGKKFKKTDYGIDAETFVSAWERSGSMDEVFEALKLISEKEGKPAMPKPIIVARASEYRKLKIPLKIMPRVKENAVDVKRLTALVMKIRAEQTKE